MAGARRSCAAVVGTTGFAVEERAVPGRTWLYARLGLIGPDGRIPQVVPGPLVGPRRG